MMRMVRQQHEIQRESVAAMSAFAGEHRKAHATGEPMCRQRTHDVSHAVDSKPQKELSKRVR